MLMILVRMEYTPGLTEFLQGGGPRKLPVRSIVMGDVPLDWEDPGHFLPQGGLPSGKYAAEEGGDGQVDLSSTGRVYEGSGYGGCGDAHPPLLEYRHPVYFHLADTVAMSGGGETARGASFEDMVGSGRPRHMAGRG